MLKAKNIFLTYKDGNKEREILSNVNLTAKNGEFVTILGPSGSGKSSLIYVLALLRQPTSGKVYLNNMSVADDKRTSKIRYDNFGYVFQQHFLIPYLSVLENVCIADYNDNLKKDAMELLERLGLKELIKSRVYKLSGGERQRVAIARALIKKPSVIFADEPTASLDHNTALEIMKLLNEQREADSTIICTTHDTSVLPDDAKRYYINNGRLIDKVD